MPETTWRDVLPIYDKGFLVPQDQAMAIVLAHRPFEAMVTGPLDDLAWVPEAADRLYVPLGEAEEARQRLQEIVSS